ncbi:hypothetical protein CLOSTMETH_01930 [[Clostridium] methylpentosum DSM 5476]|uniref:Uncharacterized protein n=1 Tax=[Clostridium] methylpentosum DSM 5476 TaxID=537013 RepID=C0EDK3_9FIRM|nr:hypothetical protein CLOSTMETH_01930 [[Clostridium] methylpentosum DSM 5476]
MKERQVARTTILYRSGLRAAEYAMCNPVDMMFAPNNLLDLSGEKLLERIQYLQSIAERFLMEEGEKILVSPAVMFRWRCL